VRTAARRGLQRGSDHYLLDVRRERFDYPALRQTVVTLSDQYRPDAVLIEDKSSGIQLIQDLHAQGHVRPIAIKPQDEKIARMYAETAKMEAGYVWLPRSAGWLDDFQAELLQFPRCRYDDQVDSVSQYLHWISARQIGDAPFVVILSRFSEEWAAEYPDLPGLGPW
jgi:predicted phage terminase large subunit-like protein